MVGARVNNVEDILVHYGKLGMKWGIRKEYQATGSIRNRLDVKGLDLFPKQNTIAMKDVAEKMNKAYGFKIDEYVPLVGRDNKKYIAYVSLKSNGSNVVHMTTNSKIKEDLIKMQKSGWFVKTPQTRVLETVLTHEAGHGLFHAIDVEEGKILTKVKNPASMDKMRSKAWKKAEGQARKDGEVKSKRFRLDLAELQMAEKLSRYAKSSLFIQEYEAEMFAAYHWSPNPPKFVDAFMSSVHEDMGKKVQPFSGRKVTYAS